MKPQTFSRIWEHNERERRHGEEEGHGLRIWYGRSN